MQTERREFLESKLTGSPQNTLDNAKELRALAKGIVYAEDFDRIKPGKVGLELEFIEIGRAHSNGTVQYKGMPRLPDTWELGYDTAQLNNLEFRRTNSITALEFNAEYLQDLSELGIYMGMYAQGISSLHLHLDKNRHPEGKWLGEILTTDYTKVGLREDTEHNTTEIRALLAPGAGYNLRVGSIANAIAMYIYASDSPLGCDNAEQQMKMTGQESLEDITSAHLAKYIASPTGRLAALKVIEDQTMFKALNPFALASGIRHEDRSQLVKAFQNIPLDEYHEDLVASLDRISISTNAMTATQVELIMSDNHGDGLELAIGASLRPFWRDKDLREVVRTR